MRRENNGKNEDDFGSDVECSNNEDYDVFWRLKTVSVTDNLAKF